MHELKRIDTSTLLLTFMSGLSNTKFLDFASLIIGPTEWNHASDYTGHIMAAGEHKGEEISPLTQICLGMELKEIIKEQHPRLHQVIGRLPKRQLNRSRYLPQPNVKVWEDKKSGEIRHNSKILLLQERILPAVEVLIKQLNLPLEFIFKETDLTLRRKEYWQKSFATLNSIVAIGGSFGLDVDFYKIHNPAQNAGLLANEQEH